MANRIAKIERKTKETQIELELNLDGEGRYEIGTGNGFFDHMLSHLARHGLMDLTGYEAYFENKLQDYSLPEEVLLRSIASMEGLPKPSGA